MSKVRMREKIAAFFALVLIFLLFVGMAGVFGWNIPVITDIARALGLAQ